MFSKITRFEKWFLMCGLLLNFVFAFITKSTILSLSNSVFAVIGVLFTSKGSPLGYVFNFLETITYIFISYDLKYYAETLINVVGFIPMCIYGFFSWLRNMNGNTQSINVKTLSKKEILIATISQLILFYPYYLMLKYFNTSLPLLSTISLVLTILGMYFGTRMSVLTYEVYIVHSFFKISLWISPILAGNYDNVPVLISSIMYLIGDIYGLYNWNRIKKIQEGKKNEN